MTEPRRSPLAGLDLAARAGGAGGVVLGEFPFRGILVLRGRDGDKRFAEGVEAVLGAGFPLAVGESGQGTDGACLLRLGPDEWWAVCGPERREALEIRLARVLADGSGVLVDCSSASVAVSVGGSAAVDLLSVGSGLDFDAPDRRPGRVARTRVGNAAVVLHRLGDRAFDIYVPRSYALSFWDWLEDAAQEFGVAIRA